MFKVGKVAQELGFRRAIYVNSSMLIQKSLGFPTKCGLSAGQLFHAVSLEQTHILYRPESVLFDMRFRHCRGPREEAIRGKEQEPLRLKYAESDPPDPPLPRKWP